MAKIMELNADNEEQLKEVGKALSSYERIQILKLLYYNSYNIGEIAEKLSIPASSAALHIRVLESSGLINTELQPGNRGSMKLCSRKKDLINIRLTGEPQEIERVKSISMPVGMYTDCEVFPTCGIASERGIIGFEDRPQDFFHPDRVKAQLVWSSGGYVEYKLPYVLDNKEVPSRLLLSFEACSEVANYHEDWKSDITIWINNIECATWHCPSDFGARRGILTPLWWDSGATQYGRLVSVEVTGSGTNLNLQPESDISLDMLGLEDCSFVSIRIGNKEDAEYKGGFNIFGRTFGDFEQDISLTIMTI